MRRRGLLGEGGVAKVNVDQVKEVGGRLGVFAGLWHGLFVLLSARTKHKETYPIENIGQFDSYSTFWTVPDQVSKCPYITRNCRFFTLFRMISGATYSGVPQNVHVLLPF